MAKIDNNRVITGSYDVNFSPRDKQISEIEKFLLHELPPEKQVLFQAKAILDKNLKMKIFLQKKIY